MSQQLTVVAINGSPHAAVGNTALMTQMVASALSREGIAVEEIFLCDKKIDYCIGCAMCLEKTKCWRSDDHAGITDTLFAADGIILASPVYFLHVTAQMKTFIDRSLGFGHKPRAITKPGMAITVSAGLADAATAHYLEGILRVYGAFPVGSLIAIATGPGTFLGKETVEARAHDLARDLATAIKEKRRYPVTGDQLMFYLFMRDLVTREKGFMRGDYQHWQETGLLEGFEAYVKQRFAESPYDPEMRKEWLKTIMTEDVAKGKKQGTDGQPAKTAMDSTSAPVTGPATAGSCLDLLKMMPLGFKAEAVPGLTAVYQFEITGSEEFTAHLRIAGGRCTFHEGPYEKPDVVVKSPADVWLAISNGALDGQSAFMSGKYRVEGNLGLLLKLKEMF